MPASSQLAPLLACLLVFALVAGCLGSAGLSDRESKERALSAEHEFVTGRLTEAPCVERGRASDYENDVDEWATVLNRSEGAVRLQVSLPYSYNTEGEHADRVNRAVYVVTENDTRRLDGDSVVEC
jgi:hypothetical protein